MHRRAFLAAGIAGVGAVGGCAGFQSDAPAPSTTPRRPTDQPLVTTGTGASPHAIRVENSLDHAVSVTLAVDRGDERVEGPQAVAAGADGPVAGITVETLPEGDRSLTVTARDDAGHAAHVQVTATDCLGNVVFFSDSDGSQESTSSVC